MAITEESYEPMGTMPVVGDFVCNVGSIEYGPDNPAEVLRVDGTRIEIENHYNPGSSEPDAIPEFYIIGGYWRVMKRDKKPENAEESVQNAAESAESDLFDLCRETISRRGGGYGLENAFADIADRWSLYLKQRFGLEIPLTPSDAADMLGEYKTARRLVRKRNGLVKRDDNVDKAGYVWWSDKLEEK